MIWVGFCCKVGSTYLGVLESYLCYSSCHTESVYYCPSSVRMKQSLCIAGCRDVFKQESCHYEFCQEHVVWSSVLSQKSLYNCIPVLIGTVAGEADEPVTCITVQCPYAQFIRPVGRRVWSLLGPRWQVNKALGVIFLSSVSWFRVTWQSRHAFRLLLHAVSLFYVSMELHSSYFSGPYF
jgi:hypothetical protein